MKKVLPAIVMALLIVTTTCKGQATETSKTEIKKFNTMEKRMFIDKVSIPQESIKEFIPRMKHMQSFIRTLPGFIKYDIYELKDVEGNLSIISISTWQDQESVDNAKNAVQAEDKRENFDTAAFRKRLNITADRGIYHEFKD